MKINKNNAGRAAEEIAATFLTQKGLKLVTRNYHCRFGEIDLIMQAGETLVFVEVRLRSSSAFGTAADSITPKKQQKLIATAQHFLQQYPDCACRFDVVLMDKANAAHIQWLCNAFDT